LNFAHNEFEFDLKVSITFGTGDVFVKKTFEISNFIRFYVSWLPLFYFLINYTR